MGEGIFASKLTNVNPRPLAGEGKGEGLLPALHSIFKKDHENIRKIRKQKFLTFVLFASFVVND
jgi:hypothetical protein